jgi:hypothetical protein
LPVSSQMLLSFTFFFCTKNFCTVQSHFMREMRSWRSRIIIDTFSHSNKRIHEFCGIRIISHSHKCDRNVCTYPSWLLHAITGQGLWYGHVSGVPLLTITGSGLDD